MSLAYPSSVSARFIRFVDVVLALWVAAWIVLGLQVRSDVRGLTQLSDTVGAAGTTIDAAGRQLDALGGVPFVGNRIRAIGRQLTQAAQSASQSAESSRDHIESLSTLLGVAIAAAPTVPLVLLYIPLRRARIREVRAVRRAGAATDGDAFDELLAHRAVERLPYDALIGVSPRPWQDLSEGRYQGLANAELKRLGIKRASSSVVQPPSPSGLGEKLEVDRRSDRA